MKSVAGGQKSTLEALSDLITTQAKKKKQQEPTPEFQISQSTSAEGMGIFAHDLFGARESEQK